MTRRDLIQKIIIGGTTVIIVPSVFTQCSKPGGYNTDSGTGSVTFPLIIDLSMAAFSRLNNAGGSVVVQGIIIANTGNNNFVAIDSTCTHQGCTIGYDFRSNTFPCPCHGSVYSANGSVITGPSIRPEKSHTITKSDNILTITS